MSTTQTFDLAFTHRKHWQARIAANGYANAVAEARRRYDAYLEALYVDDAFDDGSFDHDFILQDGIVDGFMRVGGRA